MKKKTYAANQQRKYRTMKLQKGLCVVLGCYNKTVSANYCQGCLEKRRTYEKNRSKKQMAEGFCRHCPSKQALSNLKVCIDCWFKQKSYCVTGRTKTVPSLKRLWKKQEGKCALSGLPLIPGVNASLDHKIPKSRGGSNKIGNLQWVLTSVNSFKLDHSVEEMIAICKAIISHHSKR